MAPLNVRPSSHMKTACRQPWIQYRPNSRLQPTVKGSLHPKHRPPAHSHPVVAPSIRSFVRPSRKPPGVARGAHHHHPCVRSPCFSYRACRTRERDGVSFVHGKCPPSSSVSRVSVQVHHHPTAPRKPLAAARSEHIVTPPPCRGSSMAPKDDAQFNSPGCVNARNTRINGWVLRRADRHAVPRDVLAAKYKQLSRTFTRRMHSLHGIARPTLDFQPGRVSVLVTSLQRQKMRCMGPDGDYLRVFVSHF